jgi:3'-phosphoadenosine 5'-phosphosulfate sulfotransferase (PAPS reductase)/FAD synthetase
MNASKEAKVEKFKEVMSDVPCWFSGIRRDEGATRNDIEWFLLLQETLHVRRSWLRSSFKIHSYGNRRMAI